MLVVKDFVADAIGPPYVFTLTFFVHTGFSVLSLPNTNTCISGHTKATLHQCPGEGKIILTCVIDIRS